ncbi:hypothetical protein [Streptomyces sp. NPDC002644]
MIDHRPFPGLLALYPRPYRERYGEEILEMYREATDGAGPVARRLEQFDVAAHALRVRTRTGGGQVFGRFALTAAPYALASAVAIAATELTRTLVQATGGGGAGGVAAGAMPVFLLVLAVGVLAATGRWRAARGLSVPALALSVLARSVLEVPPSAWLIPLLAVVLLMPPAATPARADLRAAAAFASMTWIAAVLGGLSTPGLGMVGLLLPALAVLAFRTAAPDGRPAHVVAVLSAGAPWILLPTGSPVGLALVLGSLAVAWAVGRTVRPRRRAEA